MCLNGVLVHCKLPKPRQYTLALIQYEVCDTDFNYPDDVHSGWGLVQPWGCFHCSYIGKLQHLSSCYLFLKNLDWHSSSCYVCWASFVLACCEARPASTLKRRELHCIVIQSAIVNIPALASHLHIFEQIRSEHASLLPDCLPCPHRSSWRYDIKWHIPTLPVRHGRVGWVGETARSGLTRACCLCQNWPT